MPAETHVRGRGGGDTRGVAEVVFEVVSEVSSRGIPELSPDDQLRELGVTGLVLIDVVETVEEELGERTLGLELDDEDLVAVRTLGGLVELITDGLRSGR